MDWQQNCAAKRLVNAGIHDSRNRDIDRISSAWFMAAKLRLDVEM